MPPRVTSPAATAAATVHCGLRVPRSLWPTGCTSGSESCSVGAPGVTRTTSAARCRSASSRFAGTRSGWVTSSVASSLIASSRFAGGVRRPDVHALVTQELRERVRTTGFVRAGFERAVGLLAAAEQEQVTGGEDQHEQGERDPRPAPDPAHVRRNGRSAHEAAMATGFSRRQRSSSSVSVR